MPYFYSEMISEMMEEEEAYLKENMEEYLLIGSDCGAGVVVFGISVADLDKENPPVYIHHEEDDFTEWNCIFDSVSEYLMTVLCDVISCVEYDIGKKVLNKLGWNYKQYKDLDTISQQLKEQGIALENAIKHKSIYGIDAEMYCCYDEIKKQLFVIRKDKKEFEICILSS